MNLLFDGHLDIAMNALDYERDQTLTVEEIRKRETPAPEDDRGVCMVTLPELRAGNTAVVTATLFARTKPWIDPRRKPRRDNSDWPSADMTHAVARGQLAYYELLMGRGELNLITSKGELQAHLDLWRQRGSSLAAAQSASPLGVILMMEGADPITRVEELGEWYELGLRCLSLAHFGHSRFACGTPPADPKSTETDGPLKELGRALLKEMARLRVALDLTHLSDISFWEAIERYDGPVCATHSDCRALSPTPRQLDDAQLRAIIERDGVIGMAIHNGMLKWTDGQAPPRDSVGLGVVADHIEHVCNLAGDAKHVAIGSDLDGGYGRDRTPRELDTHRDLQRLAPLLRDRGFSEDDVANVFSGNWLRFYDRVLPD